MAGIFIKPISRWKALKGLFTLLMFILCTKIQTSCKNEGVSKLQFADSIAIAKEDVIYDEFLSKEMQNKLTPDSVLNVLKKGNHDYISDNLTIRNTSARIRKASLGQYPGAVILSCLDSRVPVEDVFHCGIGDLFVARVAGNIANEDILGSLEYGCKVSGAKLILVLGHEHCGAVKSAIDDVKLGNITSLLSKIRAAASNIKDFKGDKISKNPAYVEAVTRQNITNTINIIRNQSPILKAMEDAKQIKIVGAEYHMATGNVEFFEN